MSIAKYRKPEYPNEWFLTDFTMEQVEGRLEKAEAEQDRLKNRITQLEDWLIDAFNNNDTERTAKEKAEAERDRLKEALKRIAAHEFRADRRKRNMIDVEEVAVLKRCAINALEDKP